MCDIYHKIVINVTIFSNLCDRRICIICYIKVQNNSENLKKELF